MAQLTPDSMNARILELAGNVRLSDRAPNTWKDLRSAGLNDLTIWPGASENTIYGNAPVNRAFRQVHDRIHLEYGLGFTLEDELKVAEIHLQDFHDDAAKAIIFCDVAEQVKHYYATGTYVQDQFAFIEEKLVCPNSIDITKK